MKDAEQLLQNLIRIPSENNGTTGYEEHVQRFYFEYLKAHGINAEFFYPEEIPGFDSHPGRMKEHSMHFRPVVVGRINGNRQGKTLLLLAHADTVPVGELALWNDSPFSGKLENGRIYGRGSGDDKWGMAAMAFIAIELLKRKCDFPGTLLIASVCDEEAGGGNGTVSLFAKGIHADEAIYLDGGSNQTIWHAGLGGGFCTVSGPEKEKIRRTIFDVKEDIRLRLSAHPCFGESFFKIIEKQFFLTRETTDGLSFFLDMIPGEDENTLKRSFEQRLPGYRFKWISRFLKPAMVPKESAFVMKLADSFEHVAGRRPQIGGGIQSDQGLVMHYGKIPCVLFGCGRRGMDGANHLPDEFIEVRAFEEICRAVLDYIAKV